MVFQLEAFGDELVQAPRASVDIEVSIAAGAVEVVVVGRCRTGQFVPICAAGHRDAHNIACSLEFAHGSVDRPLAQRCDVLGGEVVQFINGQWASSANERVADGLHLFGLALDWHDFRISLNLNQASFGCSK